MNQFKPRYNYFVSSSKIQRNWEIGIKTKEDLTFQVTNVLSENKPNGFFLDSHSSWSPWVIKDTDHSLPNRLFSEHFTALSCSFACLFKYLLISPSQDSKL
jgi:hypothetical protein